MSRQRARRRAEREAALAAQRAARAREVSRRARRRAVLAALQAPVRGLRRQRRPDSALRRLRARQDGALAAALLAGNGLLWLYQPSWLLRGSVAVVSLMAWPLLIVLIFDRGRSV